MPLSNADLSLSLFSLAPQLPLHRPLPLCGPLPAHDIDLFVVLQEAPSGMLARRRLLQPVRDSLTPELEELWVQGIYADFIEVIRSQTEAQQFHPLYLDMSQEAVLLYDRDRFLEALLERVRERLQRAGAERRSVGRYWYWDLKQADLSGEVM